MSNDHCEITVHTRKLCISCRLNKCLAMGKCHRNLFEKNIKRNKSRRNHMYKII